MAYANRDSLRSVSQKEGHFMKRIMELNGVANISMLMQIEVDKAQDAESGGTIYYMNKETYDSINQQLKLIIITLSILNTGRLYENVISTYCVH